MTLNVEGIDLTSFNDDQATQVKSTMSEAIKTNPDQYAKTVKLSKATGMPTDAVQTDPAEVEQHLKLSNINFDQMSQRNPNTANYLVDFNNAAIAHDDIDVLGKIEDSINKTGDWFGKTFENFGETTSLRFEKMAKSMLLANAESDQVDPLGFPTPATAQQDEFYTQVINNLQSQVKTTQGELQAATPQGLSTVQQGLRGGIDSLVTSAPGLFATVLTKSPIPAVASAGGFTYADSYGEARAQGLNKQQADTYASVDASIEMLTEMLPDKLLGDMLNGKELKQKVVKFILAEGVGEQVATFGQSMNAVVAGLDQELKDAPTLEDAAKIQLQRQAVTAIATAVAGGVQVGAITGTQKIIDRLTQTEQVAEQQSTIEQKQIDLLAQSAESSKLRERDAESFRQFVQQADGDKNTQVFIDGAQVSLYLQSLKPEEIAADPALQLLAKNTAEAAALGTDVAVPVADFATDIVGTPHYEALRDHMVMSENTVSPFRQEQVKVETEQFVQRMMKDAQDNISEYVQAQDIYNTVKDQLIDTGMVNSQNAAVMAQVVPAWAASYAKRQGVTVEEAYARSGLNITGPQSGEMQRLSDAALEQMPSPSSLTMPDVPTVENMQEHSRVETVPLDKAVSFQTVRNWDKFKAGEHPGDLIEGYGDKPVALKLETGEYVIYDGNHRTDLALESGAKDLEMHVIDVKNYDPQHAGRKPYKQKMSDDELLNNLFSDAPFDNVNQSKVTNNDTTNTPTESSNNTGTTGTATEKTESETSQVTPKDLYVFHNLSESNLQHADELGGLAAPSLGVGRADVTTPSNFGEITLLGHPSLLEDPSGRTFDADVYTPRHPKAEIQVSREKYKALIDSLATSKGFVEGLRLPDADLIRDNGVNELLRSDAVRIAFLDSKDVSIPHKKAEAEPLVKQAAKIEGSRWQLEENEKVKKLAEKFYRSEIEKVEAVDPKLATEIKDIYFYEDGELKNSYLSKFVYKATQYRTSGGVDLSALRDAIGKKFRNAKLETEFKKFAAEKLNEITDGKKLFKGFTNAGDRKYAAYTLDNVVKEMTQKLQGGEDYFYGPGTIRSRYASELKTIKEVQNRRNDIVSNEDMIRIKREADGKVTDALDDLTEFYKFDGNGFGYNEDAGRAIAEGPKGWSEAFRITPVSKKIITDLISYLKNLPTEYFENKMQRAVGIGEFKAAVVPNNVSADTLAILEKNGITEIRKYKSGDDADRNAKIKKSKDLLFQNNGEARGYYDPANSMIRLTEAADLSTFLHEFAHFMYEMEMNANSDLIQSVNGWFKRNAESVAKEATTAANEVPDFTITLVTVTTDDVNNFIDNKTTGDAKKDAAIRRATHEQFARGFETYLMEGTAPSIELRNAFRTFARWLTQIYKAIRGDLKVVLDDQMRQVFDRLLATDDQIAAAESRARYEPMFTDAAMAGMTDAEFEKYKQRQEKVKDKETETLRNKIIAQLTRQTKAWWKEEKNDLVREEVAKLNEQQVYVARNRLLHGDIKLDHATVKEMVGETGQDARGHSFTKIPPVLKGMTAKAQAGIHPDEAAAFLGYNSGSELLDDLISAPKISVAADINAERIMVERHGDILKDGTIEQAADEAVQNEERGKLILDELKMLSKGTQQPHLDRQTIKTMAETRIGQLSFREIHPGKYRKAEIAAAQESAKLMAKGDREGAANAKARQVLNYYLGMAATNARNETQKIVDRMARYNKKNVREEIQKAEGGYWEQIVNILERFEFRKSATLGAVDRRNQDINTWAAQRIETEGDGLVLSPAVLNESYVTHWKNVPFSDLQGINDSVKNIEHVARYSNKITRMGEEVDFQQLVTRWVASMNEKATDKFTVKRTDIVEGKNWGRWAMAQMTKIPFMASWMDGGERVGISHQILVQPFTDAYNNEIRMWEAAGKPVMDAIEGRSKADIKRHNTKIFIKEIDDNLFGHQVLAVALNTGNAGNLKKMLLGEGWANPDNESEINFNNPKLQAVLSKMTASDWQLVQLIWDQMETLYPQLAEVHRRTTGLTPPKVEATPVVTPFGTFNGGYYPVKYDPTRSQQAQDTEDKLNAQTESMFSNNASIQASVNAGATNERTGYYAPIRLSLDVVSSHFQETIHYITHHDPVREVNKLIRNKSVGDTIKAKLGPEEFAQLKPWLNDIAKDGKEAPTKMFWDAILQKLRFGVTLGAMGFKASTGIMQLSGLSNTIAETGMAPVMLAMRNILGSPKTMQEAWEFAKSNSKVLEHRAQTMDREIKSAMKSLESKRGVLAAAQQVSMKHIALIQTYMADLPSWHAGYIKGMKEFDGDEQKAYQYADWVVEQVQGSGATKDLARIMRGQSETGRMFTMFMTFFSSLWNMERDIIKGAKSGLYSPTNLAAKAMFLFTIPVLFEMLMRGELGGDDDDETRLQKMLTKVAMFPLQSIPFIRDIANGISGDYGYNMSPLASVIEQGTVAIPKLVKAGFTDEEVTLSEVKGSTKFAGALAGIPGIGQAWATGEHLYDVIVDGEELTMHQLLFGPDRK